MSETGQLNDILNAINEVNNKNIYPVYVPSLKKDVLFREMTTGQEKMLIKTIVDNPVYNSEFIFAIRQIIKENCAEDGLNVDELNLIDKTAICFTMRLKSIGDEFDYTFKDANMKKKVKISDYIDAFRDLSIPEDKIVGTDDIKVVCSYPSILTEYAIEKEFRPDNDNIEIKTVEEARKVLGDVFVNEIVKYIKQLSVNGTEFDITDLQFKDRVKILETLGNNVLSQIMSYIEDSNKEIQEALKIELELDEDDAREFGKDKLTSVLEASSDFFIIS